MTMIQPITLWVALPLSSLLVVAAIDAWTTVIKTTDLKLDQDK
jgi:hypothetical protein